MRNHPLIIILMNLKVFQNKIAKPGKPLIVDFWAPWCVPCRMTKPILEKLGQEYAGKVEFLPINADESRELLEQYKIAGIPTVMAFKNGKVAGKVVGARDEAGFRAMFEALATGNEVKVPMRQFDRTLRLTAGAIIAIIGIITHYWVVVAAGGLIAFLGIYDRCPIWAAITRSFKKIKKSES
jgi:thioredoxin 1